MISITNFREGALLNYRHGIENEHALTVEVRGLNSFGTPVKVNGVPAQMDGLLFSAPVELTQKINRVEAVTMTPYGEFSQKMTLVWDKNPSGDAIFILMTISSSLQSLPKNVRHGPLITFI